eukprot:4151494-Pyramimonas_sp.AAC.1
MRIKQVGPGVNAFWVLGVRVVVAGRSPAERISGCAQELFVGSEGLFSSGLGRSRRKCSDGSRTR